MRVILLTMLLCAAAPATAQRQMEQLGRGVMAVPLGEGKVFVGWRLLGADAEQVGFNVYRVVGHDDAAKVNSQPLVGATCFVDSGVKSDRAVAYFVRAVNGGKEEEASSGVFTLPANAPARQYISIPLKTLEGHRPGDASLGDLDGDGEYEIVLKQEMRPRDNSHSGMTGQTKLEAYKLDGTFLWRIDLGKNIREGAHYTQFIVYDLDGDGKAEVACKTADGTRDGTGKVIGDEKADHRNQDGFILEGPEFLTIFEGASGKAQATVEYVPPRGDVGSWGDRTGNRVDRFLACVAYLDGKRPSLVMCRGYYTRAVLAAWNWREGKLSRVWTFDSDDGPEANRGYRGQGNHSVSVADVDGDGRDEIVYGACVIDDDGKGLYSTGLGHGDALHVGDLDPDRDGLEVWSIHERPGHAFGASMLEARTGKVLWGLECRDPVRGLAIDIDPRHRGSECWASGEGLSGLYNAKGEQISERRPRSCNFGVWWDGDLSRELLDRNRISKWNWEDGSESPLLVAEECTSNNGSKATSALCADLFGDWREEVIWRTADNKELRIYTTTIPTEHRLTTLMHDPVYRLGVASQNVAYNQPAHVGFWLGEGMPKASRGSIVTPGN